MELKKGSKKQDTIEKFYKTLTSAFLRQARTKAYVSKEMDIKLYEWAIQTIKDRKEKDPQNEEYYSQMYEIANRFYELVSQPEIKAAIMKGEFKVAEFEAKYREQILGDHKRTYDMSSMFDQAYIMKDNNLKSGEFNRKVKFMPKEGIPHKYLDENGHEVIIEEIGILYMQQWNSLKSSISKYRIQRQNESGAWNTSEVYSHISILDMSNPSYKSAVLEELLSDNNINLSNAGGYIGEINKTPSDMIGKCLDVEKKEEDMYFYKINDQYSLKYDRADLSATMIYEGHKKVIDGAINSEKVIQLRRKECIENKEKKLNQKVENDDLTR